MKKFQALDTQILGISANVRHSQKAFSDALGLQFPLLSDFPKLKTIEAYGVLNPKRRLARRSYVIVDKEGIVRFKKVMESNRKKLPNETLLAELKKIQG